MTPTDYQFLCFCNGAACGFALLAMVLAWAAWRYKVEPGKKLRNRVKALERDLDTLSDELDDHIHRKPDMAGLWTTYTWTAPPEDTEERLAVLEAWRAQWQANTEGAKAKLDAAEALTEEKHGHIPEPQICGDCGYRDAAGTCIGPKQGVQVGRFRPGCEHYSTEQH